MDRLRIFFTGVGGQGTLTATNLLARAALLAGVDCVGGEVHGMAQRGGVVESFLLLGGLRSPRLDLGEADILMGFEPLETLRGLPYLRRGGTVFSSTDPLQPLAVALGEGQYPSLEHVKAEAGAVASRCYFLPCRALGTAAGSPHAGNTVLLGALCASGLLPFGADALDRAIAESLPEAVVAANRGALRAGAQAIRNQDAC